MKLFPNSRTRRSTAGVMLLVWLFALASGVANACLLEARGTHAHAVAAGAAATVEAPTISAGHAGAIASHHDDGVQAAKASCLKVCSEGSQVLVTPDFKVSHADCGPPIPIAVLWMPAAPVVLVHDRMDAAVPASAGPPIRVRFSRLAL